MGKVSKNFLGQLLLVMTVFTLILSTLVPSVGAQPTCEECGDRSLGELVTELEEEDGTKTNLSPDEAAIERLNAVVSEGDQEFSDILNDVEQRGFSKDEKVSSYITFENLKDEEITYESVGIVTEFYTKSPSSDELVQKQVWVDLKNEEVIRYSINELDVESEDFVNLGTYDTKEEQNQGEGIQLYSSFGFSGMSFACSISGIIACTAATGGLAVYYPWVGGVASVACAGAFAWGCSFAP